LAARRIASPSTSSADTADQHNPCRAQSAPLDDSPSAAIATATDVPVPGLPALNFTNTGAVPVTGVDRITNPNALLTTLRNGKLSIVKQFFNPFTTA
jgi:hypothetical protein